MHPTGGLAYSLAMMPGSLSEELESQARAHWAPGDKERRRLREVSGILPASVVAWGHWISPILQHLRGVSQAANHIRSWLPAGPNCPTPPEEPAFQDWILHTTQVHATEGQMEVQHCAEQPTKCQTARK